MWKKILLIAIPVAFMIFLAILSGFVWNAFQKADAIEEEIVKKGSIIRIDGSTTAYPFVRAAVKKRAESNPGSEIVVVTESSTGEGMQRLLDGEIEIAMATRLPSNAEREKAREMGRDLQVTPIGKDAVAVIVHPSKAGVLGSLSPEELRKIFFTGEITQWSDVRPTLSGLIHLYVRDPLNSGTASLFIEKIAKSEKTFAKGATNIPLTHLVVPTLAADPNGIAFTPLEWIDESVAVVPLMQESGKDIFPSARTIRDNSYPLSRIMYLVTFDQAMSNIRTFMAYLLSPSGQKILEELGFVSM